MRTFSHPTTVVMSSFTSVVALTSYIFRTYCPQYIEAVQTILCGLLVVHPYIAAVFRTVSPLHRLVVAKHALDAFTDEFYASIENGRPMSRRQRKARRLELEECVCRRLFCFSSTYLNFRLNNDFSTLKEGTLNDILRIGCLGSFLRGSSYRIYKLQRRIESARFHSVRRHSSFFLEGSNPHLQVLESRQSPDL